MRDGGDQRTLRAVGPGFHRGQRPWSERVLPRSAARIVRLPFFADLREGDMARAIEAVRLRDELMAVFKPVTSMIYECLSSDHTHQGGHGPSKSTFSTRSQQSPLTAVIVIDQAEAAGLTSKTHCGHRVSGSSCTSITAGRRQEQVSPPVRLPAEPVRGAREHQCSAN
jgi:hypothetical protein